VRHPAPTKFIVVDTNILLSAILGGRTRETIADVEAARELVVTRSSVIEALAVLSRLEAGLEASRVVLPKVMSGMRIIEPEAYASLLSMASNSLRNASASRNGSDKDAHVLALAWMYDADIWSHDRDFAGTGWPSWSSANLAAALEPAGA
jgi:predicted nucleic acid-binding protein